ncbi:MAG: RNA ligase RtcB family protein [Desulfobacterales bacterium]|nr:RNA ligase RtcB family protein [Desulfobacterales bacterium]
MIVNKNIKSNVKLIASEDIWIEGDAIMQLNKASELEGVQYAVGLPDLHPGKGNPIGAAFIIEKIIYPFLIGNDIGCGIGLFLTDIKRKKIKRDKWLNKLDGLEQPYEDDLKLLQEEFNFKPSIYDSSLGTIGGGNHFAEIQTIEKVYDKDAFDKLKLDKQYLCILVHSGSRVLGDSILRKHTEKYGAKGLSDESEDGLQYIELHDNALKWAKCNRALIAHRFVSKLGAACCPIIDVCHNSITRIDYNNRIMWLHRKGVAPSDIGPILIAGSRGTLSYLVKPIGEQKVNAWSLAHGAGRKWNRSSCKGRLEDKYDSKALIQTKNGNYIICEDKDLLYEEAPQAYKNIDKIIENMIQTGLIEIIATLNPIITYKMRKTR